MKPIHSSIKRLMVMLSVFGLTGLSVIAADSTNADNSAKNTRDKSGETLTPEDQSNAPADIKITQDIRKSLTADDSLSTVAKNVKIITVSGKVTLRGPVNTEAEKSAIAKYATTVAGAGNVSNQLEIKTNK